MKHYYRKAVYVPTAGAIMYSDYINYVSIYSIKCYLISGEVCFSGFSSVSIDRYSRDIKEWKF